MAGPLVDVHAHLAESKPVGRWVKATCDIWEYGEKPAVPYSDAGGDLADLHAAMSRAGLAHAVVVNCFSVQEWYGRWSAGLRDGLNTGALPSGEEVSPLGAWLIGFNDWLLDTAADVPAITPFVAIDPWVLSTGQAIAHLEDARRRGARGVKVHPVEQRVRFSDEPVQRLYRACADLDLTVLTHSGTARGAIPFAEPHTFLPSPRTAGLQLVAAHLGGGSWRQIVALAERWPEVTFDLSEIIAWIGAPHAPTRDELVDVIRRIGVERVMFGSDFPWYDPAEMIAIVRSLPLAETELDAVLGENAARVLALPI